MTSGKREVFISTGLAGIVGPSDSSNLYYPPRRSKPIVESEVKPKAPATPKKTPRQKKAQNALSDAYHQHMSEFKHANYAIGVGSLKIPNSLVSKKSEATQTKPSIITYYQSKYHLVFVYASNEKYVYKIHDLMYQDFLYQLYTEISKRGSVFRERKFTPNELKTFSQSINEWINTDIAEGKYFLLEKSEANQKHQRTINLIKKLEVKPHQNI